MGRISRLRNNEHIHIVALAQLRRAPADATVSDIPVPFLAADEPDERVARLSAYIAALGDIDKALMLLYLDEHPYKTIAALTGLKELSTLNLAGIDEGLIGDMALAERIDRAAIDVALGDPLVSVRAAAWNAVAMSVGPGDPWPLGDTFVTDDDARVRFYQYKALAREASAATLVQLQTAAKSEPDAMLAELAADALASGGIGSPRLSRSSRFSPSPNAITVTKGTTTSP